MKIKDIVNRSVVNLTNCEHEPIHIPGSIQPHGCLIAFSSSSFIIEFCSENCSGFFNRKPAELLGRTFSEIFGDAAFQNLSQYISKGLSLSPRPFELNSQGSAFNCTVHLSADHYILEAEPVVKSQLEAVELFNQTRHFVSYMEQSLSLKQLAAKVADETRSITGYDRVMIYKFDKEYNGEVFAESRRDDLEPFLGLHYPHTDIPSQARSLYLKNLVRMISDINYTPVPLLTNSNSDHSNLDLSLSVLRSTSPIHVQYLENMGVGATLTVSLIHNNKLWGLIACHHYAPKYISPDMRLSAQLQGHFLTSQIDVRQNAEEYDITREINLSVEQLLDERLELNNDSLAMIINHPALLKVCNANGAAIIFNGSVYHKGLTPAGQDLEDLFGWCGMNSGSKGHLSTNKLAGIYPAYSRLCETAAGILYHALGNNPDTAIIWFRPESIHEISWGGDPNKAIVKDEKGLHPRKSFELFKEEIKCKSREWLQPELNGAATYAHALQKHIHLLQLTTEETRYKKLNEVLKETNEELENINWISTHDLQEPLRKIQILASRIIGYDERNDVPEEVFHSVQRMNASAQRMQTLLKDILAYGRIKHSDNKAELIDLNELLQRVLNDMKDEINDKHAVVECGPLKGIKGIPFLLNQLFMNLIRNSIKFGRENVPVNIRIYNNGQETKLDLVYNRITVEDNGIGFEEEFSESIFRLFTRLHHFNEYTGSGVGLALCKKIMQNHNGYITAEGEPGKGAKFHLYFPVT